MKFVFFLLFLISANMFSQVNKSDDEIKFSPKEVYSSAIIEFDFEKKSSYVLDIESRDGLLDFNKILISKEFNPKIKKIDLSLLSQGEYFLKIYENDKIIYQTEFLKK